MTVFELVAKLTLDSSEYENDLKKQSENGGKLAGAWGKIGGAVKVGAAAIGAASAAVGALTKKSIDAYAEFEQLKGGVEKLYGSAADELMGYANEAYKTSGMSANKYMEQATSFSAALINSLGGDTSAAAKQTDVAMRAISDNFNTFGGDIQNVQNAFQGFAKQNYTMLDNLKLGYGGTKSEMERLIADANEYAAANGMAADLSIDSFSDIVTAIDLVQQKQGIAGTTAKEAATTIEGSLNMTKAAWDNLITGLADPDADIGQLMDNLIVAIVGDKDGEGLLNNIIPAIERALEGIGQFISAAVPALAEKLPGIIQTVLPSLIQSAISLVTSLIQALPGIVSSLVAMLPQLVNMVITGIINLLKTATPTLVAQIPSMINAIVSALLGMVGVLVSAGASLISSLASAISSALSSAASRAANFAKQIPQKIKNGLGNLRSVGLNLIEGLWGGIKSKFDSVVERVKNLASKLPKAVKKVLGISSPSKVFAEVGKWIPEGLAVGIEGNVGSVESAMDAMHDATAFTPASGASDMGRTGGSMETLLNALTSMRIEVVTNIDGKEVARTTAPFMQDELNRRETFANRKLGYV